MEGIKWEKMLTSNWAMSFSFPLIPRNFGVVLFGFGSPQNVPQFVGCLAAVLREH